MEERCAVGMALFFCEGRDQADTPLRGVALFPGDGAPEPDPVS